MSPEADFKDPIYQGGLQPATFLGVPFLPFILGTMVFALLGLVGFFAQGPAGLVAVVIPYFVALNWARRVSRRDEARLLQLILKMRLRLRQRSARAIWGAVTFSPRSKDEVK